MSRWCFEAISYKFLEACAIIRLMRKGEIIGMAAAAFLAGCNQGGIGKVDRNTLIDCNKGQTENNLVVEVPEGKEIQIGRTLIISAVEGRMLFEQDPVILAINNQELAREKGIPEAPQPKEGIDFRGTKNRYFFAENRTVTFGNVRWLTGCEPRFNVNLCPGEKKSTRMEIFSSCQNRQGLSTTENSTIPK